MFIVFEGIDGTGKTTLINNLKKYFCENENINIFTTREPGGKNCPAAEKIRSLIFEFDNLSIVTELFLFLASRIEHVKDVILPNLNQKIIFCDRYYFSTIAYQSSKNITSDFINEINVKALELFNEPKLVYPNITFFLIPKSDQDLYKIMERKSHVKENRMDEKDFEFYHEVNENYKKIIKKYNNPNNFISLDPLLNESELLEQAKKIIKKMIKNENI
ncbi:hypothetical protein ASO20_01535 [Mycoplasma sp. (ex Biomphalaria glabrata)]|uniref:dTMP kinase n=1 Tax=Mycoplasma sp. (ex Biomphalaria glabrata) TaxID=1749074 RepID=UPI00073A9F04|nr:dTMP kinase [Mycoplasma sp. (ex Biomphalaria glabrata)]ALV23332.1 hypothetical protein ASO20_01535 [Mycoplasma sp. (ex Biomphalaria glabrata)]